MTLITRGAHARAAGLTVAGLTVAGLSIVAAPAAAEELAALAARVKPSVVHLSILDAAGGQQGTGTGFFISTSGLIVTSDHVIANASGVVATLVDGSKRRILGALARDQGQDVAILQAEPGTYPALELDASSPLEVGAKVAVIGSPLGLSWSLSEGIVSAYRKNGLPAQMRESHTGDSGPRMQITAAFSPGSSGSPVLSLDSGKVVGVAESVIRSAQGLNFAIPIEAVVRLRATIGPETEPQPFHARSLSNLIISAIFFTVLGAGLLIGRRFVNRREKKSGGSARIV